MNNKNEQLTTLPLRDLIWNILGDDSNGLACAQITKTTAHILQEQLKDSLKWKVEFFNRDGEELSVPVLWRYSEWKSSTDLYERQKIYAHKERVVRWILQKNVDNLAKAIGRMNKMPLEVAQPIAYNLIKIGNMEVIALMGLSKLITREEEL